MSLHNRLAPTPPMGWNSYDLYGVTVTEAEVRANAEAMAEHLLVYGWEYVVIDGEWAEPAPADDVHREPTGRLRLDAYGRLLPALTRFPSADGEVGFKPLADTLHRLGLKLGIHIMRGIPRQAVEANLPVVGTPYHAQDIARWDRLCAWCPDMAGVNMAHPGGQAYYDSLAALYASWGVDYIKADDMSSPYYADEIEGFANALRKTGRDIVLSLSPGNAANIENAEHLMQHCELWRISADFWDRWDDLYAQFERCAAWSPYAGKHHWADADMLPLGRIGARVLGGEDRQTRFTTSEQITLMSLWSIARSPLMFGGDLCSMDADTLALLTNAEVIAVNQNCVTSRQVRREDDQVVWEARMNEADTERVIGLFNLSSETAAITVSLSELGLEGLFSVRDLWQRRNIGQISDALTQAIEPHGARLYRLSQL